MVFKLQRKRIDKIPETRILDELEKAASHFNYIQFGWRDFNDIAIISANTIKNHFGSWKKGLDALRQHLQKKGMDLSPCPYAPNRVYSNQVLFDEMARIWNKVGQRPSRIEWEMAEPKIAYQTYKLRFGGWTNAGMKFIEYKMGSEILSDDFVLPDRENRKMLKENKIEYKLENTRNVSLSLRLKVLSRDNFRCVFCGKSPATNLGTKLHIDHIKPFSKGGKSILDNLQTLCEECNLGKSDND